METILFSDQKFLFRQHPQLTSTATKIGRMAVLTTNSSSTLLRSLQSSISKRNFAATSENGSKRQRLSEPNLSSRLFISYMYRQGTTVFVKLCTDVGEGIFTQLAATLGGSQNFSLDVSINLGSISTRRYERLEFRGVKVSKIHTNSSQRKAYGVIFEANVSPSVCLAWHEDPGFGGEFSMMVKISDDILSNLLVKRGEMGPLTINKKMLDEEIASDAVIIAQDGIQIKCHKSFLSVHSPMFRAMFESDMKEGNTSTVEITDMCEASVRALLEYLYCWDITKASKSCALAFELLTAADMYCISELTKVIQDLILLKSNPWFDISITVQLLQFAKNKMDADTNGKYKQLVDKSMSVLKSKPKADVMTCPKFKQALQDSQNAMEICSYLMFN